MKVKWWLIIPIAFLFHTSASAQLQDLKGKIIAKDDVEGIHILNKTALKYTVTDTDGSFEILAKVNDTLTISSLKYEIKELLITQNMLATNALNVTLKEKVTELDEVLVGKILLGDLNADITNLDIKTPINFYDLGIPGYKGKPKTLGERKLAEATSGGGLIPFAPLINAITGRTKYLKKIVQLERDIKCVERLKDTYRKVIFTNEEYSQEYQSQFFEFIMDSDDLQNVCISKNVLTPVTFLQKELKQFETLKSPNVKKD